MPRLFTGLEVPADVGFELAMYRGGLPGARWIDPENYHITLRFIGDVDEGVARELFMSLGEAKRRPAMDIALDDLASFGGDKPRSIFARVAPSQGLIELQSAHERMARRLGLPPEKRKFTPHVTLARLRDASPIAVADYLAMRGRFHRQRFMARRFVLFSSRDSVGGGPYVVEAAYPLG